MFRYFFRSRCGQADSVMNSHTTGLSFKTRWVGYISIELLTDYHNNSIDHNVHRSLMCVEGRGRVSRSGLTCCVLQCEVPHQ